MNYSFELPALLETPTTNRKKSEPQFDNYKRVTDFIPLFLGRRSANLHSGARLGLALTKTIIYFWGCCCLLAGLELFSNLERAPGALLAGVVFINPYKQFAWCVHRGHFCEV